MKEVFKRANINISDDLWKYALLRVYISGEEVKTEDLIRLLAPIFKGTEYDQASESHPDQRKYYQIVRNLKSNKDNLVNWLSRNYVEEIYGGFGITQKGIDYIKNEKTFLGLF